MPRNHYFLVDILKDNRRKKYIRKMEVLDFYSRVFLAKGYFSRKYSPPNLVDFWQFNIIPPSRKEDLRIRPSDIMWYINKHITIQDKIWNGSFLHGLAQFGTVSRGIFPNTNPSFLCLETPYIRRIPYILYFCPFGGTKEMYEKTFKWSNVPALSLFHDVKSYSFMAGIFSMGEEYTDDGRVYAEYDIKMKKWFKEWGIPLEKIVNDKVLISPFWPSLFHEWMPLPIRMWRNIEHAANAEKYAGILWKIYRYGQIKRDGLPYLREVMYYFRKYTTPEKILGQNMKRMWVDCGLTTLDNRIIDLLRGQQKQTKKTPKTV